MAWFGMACCRGYIKGASDVPVCGAAENAEFRPYECIKGQTQGSHTPEAECLSVEMGRRFQGHYSHIFGANIHWDHSNSHSLKSKRAQEWEDAGNSLSPFPKIDQRIDTTKRAEVDLGVNHNNFNSCLPAFPRYTLMEADVPKQYSYSINYDPLLNSMAEMNAPVIFIGCRNPAESPLYVKMDACNGVGGIIGDIENSCSITAVAWYRRRHRSHAAASGEEIGEALAWGFELSWFGFYCAGVKCIDGSDYCYFRNDYNSGGKSITCFNYTDDHWTPCDLLYSPHHLDFHHNHNYELPIDENSIADAQNVESPLLSDNAVRSSSLELCGK
nr:rust resistance kinase Lr10-like [Ipomoea batatas]